MHLKLLQQEQLLIKLKKVSRISPQNSSGTVRNEKENFGHDEEILTERYISLEEKAANY